jgi:hypothetical protein
MLNYQRFLKVSSKLEMRLVRVIYPGYHGPLVTTQNSRNDQFTPVANRWGTIHPIPGNNPSLQVEEEGPPT